MISHKICFMRGPTISVSVEQKGGIDIARMLLLMYYYCKKKIQLSYSKLYHVTEIRVRDATAVQSEIEAIKASVSVRPLSFVSYRRRRPLTIQGRTSSNNLAESCKATIRVRKGLGDSKVTEIPH